MYHALWQGREKLYECFDSAQHERKICDDFNRPVCSEALDNQTAVATYDSIAQAFNDDDSLPESGLRILIDEAKRDNKITRDVGFNEVADISILLEAQRELGIKEK